MLLNMYKQIDLVLSVSSVENSLDCLTGIFMGNDPELQLEAAWCLTNLAAGTDDHTNAVIKCAAPYLITYLSSGNSSLQV